MTKVCLRTATSRLGAAATAVALLTGGASAGAGCRPPALQGAPVAIRLDPGATGQVVSGWEAVAQAGQEDTEFPLYQQELFDRAVNDLGINRVRLEIRSGVEQTRDLWREQQSGTLTPAQWRARRYATDNDNDDPFTINCKGFHFSTVDHTVNTVVLPLKARLNARGESLFVNATYVAFARQNGPGLGYHHDNPEEYAEFVLATYLHLESTFGWTPDAWNVILEPDNTDFWRGASIGRAMVATARRLRQHGFTPRFIAPSTTNMANAPRFFDALLAIPGAQDDLAELAYHRYHGVSDTTLQEIASRGERFGVQTAMLEHMESGYEELHADLTRGHVSAWQKFTLAYPRAGDSGKYYAIDTREAGRRRIVLTDTARYLRQYFRYVRRGATRIGATSADGRLDPVAFTNADGRTVVIVKAALGGSVAVSGLRAGRYGISYATRSESREAPHVNVAPGRDLVARIPSAGVLTIYAQPGN